MSNCRCGAQSDSDPAARRSCALDRHRVERSVVHCVASAVPKNKERKTGRPGARGRAERRESQSEMKIARPPPGGARSRRGGMRGGRGAGRYLYPALTTVFRALQSSLFTFPLVSHGSHATRALNTLCLSSTWRCTLRVSSAPYRAHDATIPRKLNIKASSHHTARDSRSGPVPRDGVRVALRFFAPRAALRAYAWPQTGESCASRDDAVFATAIYAHQVYSGVGSSRAWSPVPTWSSCTKEAPRHRLRARLLKECVVGR